MHHASGDIQQNNILAHDSNTCNDANPLALLHAQLNSAGELEVKLPRQVKIASDAGAAFTNALQELTDKYADVFKKPGKPVERAIQHKIELLDPNAPIAHHRQ